MHLSSTAGAAAVADVLPALLHLDELGLLSNDIGDDGASALAAPLASVTALGVIDLAANRIGEAGFKKIATVRLLPVATFVTLHVLLLFARTRTSPNFRFNVILSFRPSVCSGHRPSKRRAPAVCVPSF
jgi:hypothetical protein